MLLAEYVLIKDLAADILEGGAGSGHFGHKGRPGSRGGSLAGKGISAHGSGPVSSTRMARYLISRHSRGRYVGIDRAASRIQEKFPGQSPERYGRALKKAGYPGSDIGKVLPIVPGNLVRLARTGRRPDAVIGTPSVGAPSVGTPSFTVGQPAPGKKVSVADLDAAVKAAAEKNGFGVKTRGALDNIEHYFSKGSGTAGSIGYSLAERGGGTRLDGYIGGFFLNRSSQGKGLGGDVIGAIAKKMLESGGGRMELYANGAEGIGRYAWAVMGFDFSSKDAVGRAETSFKGYLASKGVGVANLSFKHSWEIAAFTEGGRKYGKKFLIDHFGSYNATLDVSPNSAGMQVLANYLSGRVVNAKS